MYWSNCANYYDKSCLFAIIDIQLQRSLSIKSQIALITILTDNVPALTRFYQDALGFSVKTDMGEYVEFESEGVRFAVCARSIMKSATGDLNFAETPVGQSFELAFPLVSPAEVDDAYADIVARWQSQSNLLQTCHGDNALPSLPTRTAISMSCSPT
jgi:hypothetical protein